MKSEKNEKIIVVEVVFEEDMENSIDGCLEKLIDMRFESVKKAICNSKST